MGLTHNNHIADVDWDRLIMRRTRVIHYDKFEIIISPKVAV